MVEHAPDVAVVDVRMPTMTDDGLRAAIRSGAGAVVRAVLLLSQYVEVAYFEELLAYGDGGVAIC
ncbi:MAG: hypothetical protein U0R78_05565 [Nocardioidaceae bacterium]